MCESGWRVEVRSGGVGSAIAGWLSLEGEARALPRLRPGWEDTQSGAGLDWLPVLPPAPVGP